MSHKQKHAATATTAVPKRRRPAKRAPKPDVHQMHATLAALADRVGQLDAAVRTVLQRLPGPGIHSQPEGDASGLAFPALPEPDADGQRPARETALAILAGKMLQRRVAAGLSQQELAARAGVRAETVSRLETGKHAPNTATFLKLERVLRAAGQ